MQKKLGVWSKGNNMRNNLTERIKTLMKSENDSRMGARIWSLGLRNKQPRRKLRNKGGNNAK
jgi:hypothetical protein